MRQRWIRRIVLIVIALAVVAAIVVAFMPAPIPVDLDSVQTRDLLLTVDEDGKTRIKERYIVSAPLAGRLLRIELDPGDMVEPGSTLLASIEPRDPDLLDPRAEAQAQARLQAAEAAFRMAEPRLQKALAERELARTELQRISSAFERGAASQKELDDAELIDRLRSEEAKAEQFARQIAQFELELARAALLRTQSDDQKPRGAEPFRISAPCRGRVLQVFQESTAVVDAGMPLLEVGDPANLELVIDVLSTDAVKIEPGDDVIIEGWGGGANLNGKVRIVEPAAFTKISALGVEEQRVNVIVDFVDPYERWRTLGDAYRIEARIIIDRRRDALAVPVGALFRQGEEWAVFVANDGRAELRTVQLGLMNTLYAEVKAGLQASDRVILHPGDSIADGVRIVQRRTP